MVQVSRRALLTRAGIGTGAGVVALLGGAAAPALGGSDRARSRERAPGLLQQAPDDQLVHALAQHAEGARRVSATQGPAARDPQAGAGALRDCSRRCSARRRRPTTTSPTRSRRAPCARSATAAKFALALEDADARHRHRRRVDHGRRGVAAVDRARSSPATASTSPPSRCSTAARPCRTVCRARSASKTRPSSSPSSSPTRWCR